MTVAEALRNRMIAGTTALFAHGPDPLADTMRHRGDPGLFGPGSVTWRLLGDPSAFVGGIRSLLVQAAHPEVAAGVVDHSVYEQDPLGRLSRTSAFVTATGYGAMPEVAAAVETVTMAHRPVHGRSSRGRPYSASKSDLAAWVHHALVDSFLVAYQTFGPGPLEQGEADRYVAEQARLGALMGVTDSPATSEELTRWIVDHPDTGWSDAGAVAVEFLRSPPLPAATLPAYRVLLRAAIATLPSTILEATGLHPMPGAVHVGRTAIRLLRWGLGASPAWHAALIRSGARVPEELFRRPLLFDR